MMKMNVFFLFLEVFLSFYKMIEKKKKKKKKKLKVQLEIEKQSKKHDCS
jgi:hypothetical protein